MTRLDRFLAYSESHRLTVCVIAALLTALIAWVDWQLFDVSIGFLYLFPILLSAAALNTWQILRWLPAAASCAKSSTPCGSRPALPSASPSWWRATR